MNIVCRLGAFYMQMSLGTLMAESALAEIMECCYSPNMAHIFTDKAVALAVRAHFLVKSALTTLLLEEISSYDTYKEEMSGVFFLAVRAAEKLIYYVAAKIGL